MGKLRTKATRIGALCVLSTVLMSVPVFASTASSPATATVFGKSYAFTSEVWDRYPVSSPTAEAVVDLTSKSGNVPAGYMGGQARLYKSDGQLKQSSTMKYNNVSSSGLYVYSPATNISGTYYAQSYAAFYTGDGYVGTSGNKSPNLILETNFEETSLPSNLKFQKAYSVNSNGETYGSALLESTIGVEPDLISAVGTNGVNGYIKADDLTPDVSNPQEAINSNLNNGESVLIPLYDVDGSTIISEFKLVTNYEQYPIRK